MKKFRLSEIDLARAATAPAHQKKSLIKAATGDRGYPYYEGIRSNLGAILNVALNVLVPASIATKEQIKVAIARDCIGSGEIIRNQNVGEGLHDYAIARNVTAAEFDFEPVALGRAGPRRFWAPYILKIDSKKYIPFFDFRGATRLTPEARRFVFSINHTHIRRSNPTEYSDVGFVIFQFEDLKEGIRKAIPHFDKGITFWTDQEIGMMIDETYRILDEVRRAA